MYLASHAPVSRRRSYFTQALCVPSDGLVLVPHTPVLPFSKPCFSAMFLLLPPLTCRFLMLLFVSHTPTFHFTEALCSKQCCCLLSHTHRLVFPFSNPRFNAIFLSLTPPMYHFSKPRFDTMFLLLSRTPLSFKPQTFVSTPCFFLSLKRSRFFIACLNEPLFSAYFLFLFQEKQFSLCDFGSAGGTFVRLASGVPTPLYPSMMIMLGKHQVRSARVP